MSGLINPSSVPIKLDASGNVLANIAAQNINPNINNPYLPTLLSHQTGLSVTATAAATPYAIGAAITMPRNGLISIFLIGHVSAGAGAIDFTVTRGTTIYYFGNATSTTMTGAAAALANAGLYGVGTSAYPINISSANILSPSAIITSTDVNQFIPSFFPLLNGDVIQFRAENNTAGDIVYITDVTVILQ